MRRPSARHALPAFLLLAGTGAHAGSVPTGPAGAQPVDVALVLALDVSGSVSDGDFILQRSGYASAFADRRVVDALTSGPYGSAAVTLVQWSGAGEQTQVVGWTVLRDQRSALAFGGVVLKMSRLYNRQTAVGDAIDYAATLLEDAPYPAARRVIDVSGDGRNNSGGPADEARDRAVAEGDTINGLPILGREEGVDRWYAAHVIGGPEAFLVSVADMADFAEALKTKLLREVKTARPAEDPPRGFAGPDR